MCALVLTSAVIPSHTTTISVTQVVSKQRQSGISECPASRQGIQTPELSWHVVQSLQAAHIGTCMRTQILIDPTSSHTTNISATQVVSKQRKSSIPEYHANRQGIQTPESGWHVVQSLPAAHVHPGTDSLAQ
jgi:hypothetical protein